jgi:hypothetical protein
MGIVNIILAAFDFSIACFFCIVGPSLENSGRRTRIAEVTLHLISTLCEFAMLAISVILTVNLHRSYADVNVSLQRSYMQNILVRC